MIGKREHKVILITIMVEETPKGALNEKFSPLVPEIEQISKNTNFFRGKKMNTNIP